MWPRFKGGKRRAFAAPSSAAGLAVLAAGALWSMPTEPDPVVRVEEEWELVLNDPHVDRVSPQFTTVMSPFPNMDSYYAQILWNHRETPEFTPGGIQLHSYRGETLLRMRSVEWRTLSTQAETIRWTQSLQTDGVSLTVSIQDGHSTTWGSFGRDMYISSSANLADLGQYRPDFSASNACVSFGSNRVESLILKRVRYYGRDGLIAEDNTPRRVM
ncbi:MAG: hypothetical protein BroJett003_02060 [Planctomycetota bacterium]|nr:MAG: hypothetical protein BroJett003_02060 [Planctomycetota bacterium]